MTYDYDRRIAAQPKAKFRLGDRVDVMDGNKILFSGEVSYVGSYDETIEGYRYKVQEDGSRGSRVTYNESSLRKSKGKTAGRRHERITKETLESPQGRKTHVRPREDDQALFR